VTLPDVAEMVTTVDEVTAYWRLDL